MEFEDFELLVQKKDSGYNVSVTKSPAGRAEAEFSLSEEDLEKIKTLLDLIFADKSDENLNESFSRESGSILFDKLFSGNVKNRFHESLGLTQAQHKKLRIKLTLQEELQFIPWEFMYDKEKQLFLSRSSAIVLARVPEAPQSPRKLSVNPPLKILVAISHPLSLLGTDDEFDMEKQRSIIEKALENLVGEKKIYYEFLDIVNVNTLSEKLRKQFDVLHFIGHGTIGGLLIEDDDGNTYTITSQKFAELIEGKGLNLVLLESCWSSAGKEFTGVAQKLLLMGVPAVVAMQYPILVKSASIFFSEFYKCVAAGLAVDEAVSEARKIVYASPGQNCLDWATPTLYMNAPDGVLFSLGEARSLPERHDVVELYTAPHFVGRREEMWTLKKALSSDKRIVLIEGFAAIGKSVLMNRVIQDVRPDFKGVFAVHCDEGYTIDLLFGRLNTFFLAFDEGALNVQLPSQEKIPLLLNVLQAHKYLIVLDNFESLLENGVKEDFEALLVSFLSQPHQSKIVVTTRRSFAIAGGRLSGSMEHIGLGGLRPRHSVWLMERLGMRVSREDMGRIHEKTGGHPYAIEFVKELLRKEPLERILELLVSRGNILQLLEEVIQTLAPEELSVLERISVLRKPVYREALDFLVGKDRKWIDGLLDKDVLFYDEKTEFYYVHALVREYAYERLKDKRGAHVRAAKYYEETAKITRNIWEGVEWWYHNFEGGEYEKAGEIVVVMTEPLHRWGYWGLVRELLEKTVETTRGELRVVSLHNLGIVCRSLGENRKALECYEESLGLFRGIGDKKSTALSLYEIGNIYYSRGDYEEALRKSNEHYEDSEFLVMGCDFIHKTLVPVDKFYFFRQSIYIVHSMNSPFFCSCISFRMLERASGNCFVSS